MNPTQTNNVRLPRINIEQIPKIKNMLPAVHFLPGEWTYIQNLKLADPNYNTPGSWKIYLFLKF